MTLATTTPVDVEQVLELLDRAVAERGEDFIYDATFDARLHGGRSCFYRLPNGRPGCIAGLVVSYVAPGTLPYLAEGVSINGQDALTDFFTSTALAVLRAAQRAQDKGARWGVARDKGRASAREISLSSNSL